VVPTGIHAACGVGSGCPTPATDSSGPWGPVGQSQGRGTDRTERERVGIRAVSTAATSSATVAVDAPYVSSSQPPSSGASGMVVNPRNCDEDAIRPCRSSGVMATR
jgi:hypothetical protein